MDERNSRDHVIQLYNAQKTKRDKFEKDIATAKTDKEKANAKAHIEVATKAMDDIIVNEVTIDLTNWCHGQEPKGVQGGSS